MTSTYIFLSDFTAKPYKVDLMHMGTHPTKLFKKGDVVKIESIPVQLPNEKGAQLITTAEQLFAMFAPKQKDAVDTQISAWSGQMPFVNQVSGMVMPMFVTVGSQFDRWVIDPKVVAAAPEQTTAPTASTPSPGTNTGGKFGQMAPIAAPAQLPSTDNPPKPAETWLTPKNGVIAIAVAAGCFLAFKGGQMIWKARKKF